MSPAKPICALLVILICVITILGAWLDPCDLRYAREVTCKEEILVYLLKERRKFPRREVPLTVSSNIARLHRELFGLLSPPGECRAHPRWVAALNRWFVTIGETPQNAPKVATPRTGIVNEAFAQDSPQSNPKR